MTETPHRETLQDIIDNGLEVSSGSGNTRRVIVGGKTRAALTAAIHAMDEEQKRKDLFWPHDNEFDAHIYEIRNGKNVEYVREHAQALIDDARNAELHDEACERGDSRT